MSEVAYEPFFDSDCHCIQTSSALYETKDAADVLLLMDDGQSYDGRPREEIGKTSDIRPCH
jgi:hypothetical protein